MKCYKCKAGLPSSDYCTSCGAEVKVYKKIIKSSEIYYNQGLAMAQMRELTSAADSLRHSLKLNKNNIKARNLLGLVYFEMGEAVAALSEWVISKNLQPTKNIADDYLSAIKKNSTRLDTINQTIKKYNQALLYAQQNSSDLAIIQLKKVLNLNPNLVKGHLLLALLYMKENEYEKAVKPLKKAMSIDKSNPLTIKYMNEVKKVVDISEKKVEPSKKASEERKVFVGEDVILPQPTSYQESNAGGITILNIIIGIAIGAALMWFLVFPAKRQAIAEENNKQYAEISGQLELKSTTIATLESDKEILQKEKEDLEKELSTYKGKDGIIQTYESMLVAMDAYIQNDSIKTMEALANVDTAVINSEDFKKVYGEIKEAAAQEATRTLYEQGYNRYRNGDYQTAIEVLAKAYEIGKEDAGVIYYLGRSYQRSGDSETGKKYLQEVIDKYPNTQYASQAKDYIKN